jgi:hypothetical protein
VDVSELLIKGADAIARAIGEGRHSIPELVEREGLPAWQKDGKGPWKARPASLDKWLEGQEKKHAKAKSCQ